MKAMQSLNPFPKNSVAAKAYARFNHVSAAVEFVRIVDENGIPRHHLSSAEQAEVNAAERYIKDQNPFG